MTTLCVVVSVLLGGWALPSSGVTASAAEAPSSISDDVRGLALETMTPLIALSLSLEPDTRGAVVTDVVDGSPAAVAGLMVGDVITEIDRMAIVSADQAARQLDDGRSHLLRVKNARGHRFLTLPAS
jgi:S1-C subfamily serine protease